MEIVTPNTLTGTSAPYSGTHEHTYYADRLTARVFVIDKDSNIGLIRHEKYPLLFPPGGGIEEGETIFEAAAREVCEELGVHCIPETDLGVFEHYHDAWKKHFLIHHIVATTDRSICTTDRKEYDTDLERQWVNINKYDTILSENIPSNTRGEEIIWEQAVHYFLQKIL